MTLERDPNVWKCVLVDKAFAALPEKLTSVLSTCAGLPSTAYNPDFSLSDTFSLSRSCTHPHPLMHTHTHKIKHKRKRIYRKYLHFF